MNNYTSENTSKFLETYKKLEFLESIDPTRYERIKRSNYQLFDTFRHVRNCLTHTPKTLNDNYIFHVSNEILELLESIVHQMVTKAIEEGTRVESIYTAKATDTINDSILIMDRKNYANLPVLDDKGVVKYVVSNRAIISALASNMNQEYDRNVKYTIEDLKEFFELDANKDIYYEFMDINTYAYEAKMKFIGYNPDHKRCSLIFITKNGSKNEPILGLVSPSDVLDI